MFSASKRMPLRVECEHAGLVPSDEQEGGHVLGEHLEPRHIHGSRASALARHRQGPEWEKKENKPLACI